MGRLQYLERLVLGRSAFQSGPSVNNDRDETTELQQQQQPTTERLDSTGASPQQYDAKGRPFNSATEAQNASLRHASNEVLALVGVVERKDSADAQLQIDTTLRRATREHLLILEDNRGNEWSAGLDVLSWFALWWPTALVRRVQVGLHSPDLSFTQILNLEASMLLGNGWRGILVGLLPGTGIAILHKVLWQLSALIAEEIISSIQTKIVASTIHRRTAKRLIRSLTILMDVFYVAIDVLLLPLEAYALARQLNIAPPTPWRPLMTTQIPYLFRSAYASTFTTPTAFLTFSAAPHILAYSLLTRDASPSAPAFSDMTSFRLPSISEHDTKRSHWPTPRPSPYDPFAAILRQTSTIRQRFLRAVGWDVHEQQRPGATHGWETDAQVVSAVPVPGNSDSLIHSKDGKTLVAHRSTTLARLPATWLGFRTDTFLLRVLMLPLEGAVMRKMASFYLSTGMPIARNIVTGGDNQTMAPIPGLWSFVTGRAGRESLAVVAGRLSQVGLSMALTLGVEVVFFGVVYALTRRDGVGRYGWKRLRHDGGVEGVVEEDILGEDDGTGGGHS